jgi:prepilin-type N-terminal cleavage/methylation domain-containing protein
MGGVLSTTGNAFQGSPPSTTNSQAESVGDRRRDEGRRRALDGRCREYGWYSRHHWAVAGFTLLESVFVLTLSGVLMAIAVPLLLTSVDRSRGLAAARYLGARMALARSNAVRRSTVIALYFEAGPRGTTFSLVQDGNGNGVRTRDIQASIDRVLEAPMLISDLFPGVEIGLVPHAPAPEAVQLSGTSILSFTPLGTATSGSIYLRGKDGTQWAVRILGVTARTRVLRFDPATQAWVNAW